jgi:hypothetical protein
MIFERLFRRLSTSRFRSSFNLSKRDLDYIQRVGLEKIKDHARDFIEERLAPKFPKNDGRQTPFKGHPVFKAQHAVAACCRGCLKSWHGMTEGVVLTQAQKDYVLDLIMKWIQAQIEQAGLT